MQRNQTDIDFISSVFFLYVIFVADFMQNGDKNMYNIDIAIKYNQGQPHLRYIQFFRNFFFALNF